MPLDPVKTYPANTPLSRSVIRFFLVSPENENRSIFYHDPFPSWRAIAAIRSAKSCGTKNT